MSTDARSPLVLIVDDQNATLQLIGEVLDHAGYQVMPALSGEQAIARASLRRPDLVLLDFAMPGMSGVETCRRLHQLPGLADLPVLFVTAANDRASLVTAFGSGAVDYITKPFVVEELLARVRTHLDLKIARDRLAAMVREREDVVDVVAHDLKNPLTCILFAAQSLRRSAPRESRGTELANEIEACAEEALQYIQRFLVRGAAQERLRQFAAEAVQLRDIALDAARLLQSAAEARGVRLRITGDAAAFADSRAVRNVLQSLLSNAIRHSPQEETVEVTVAPSKRDGYALCIIADRGPGVPRQIAAKLFQRHVGYAEADAAGANPYSTGLGLAIARHDVVQMGGHLWYEPRPGGGSLFAFELPQQLEGGDNGFAGAAAARGI
ncbi:MAG: hybrid sensor histidine kinase/response regulator [Pseudomonadota bacterium]